MRELIAIVLALVASAATAGPPDLSGVAPAPVPNADSFERLRDAVLPSAEEVAFRKVGWRASLWSAVVEAQREEKPILLWAMNGHPLGCT